MRCGVKVIRVALLLLSDLVPVALQAQGTDTATVTITILDSRGAMVPDATVSVRTEGTAVVEMLKTGSVTGICTFNALNPSSYVAKVQAPMEHDHIVLRVGQQLDPLFALEVESASQSMVVQGGSPPVNAVGSALGAEVTNRCISDACVRRELASFRSNAGEQKAHESLKTASVARLAEVPRRTGKLIEHQIVPSVWSVFEDVHRS